MPESAGPFEVIESVTPEGYTEPVYAGRPKNLTELFQNTVEKYGDREAFVDLNTRLSYRQVESLVSNVASNLSHDWNIKPGDRVVLMLRNGMEFAVSLFALARTGAITVPLNNALKGEELAFQIKDCGASLLITDPEFHDVIIEAISGVKSLKNVFFTGREIPGGESAFSELLKQKEYPPASVTADEDDTAVLMYTSGTTGKPKGALLSHKGIIASAMNSVRLCDFRAGRDRLMVVAPLFHITGLAMNLCAAIYSGVPAVFVKRFKTEDTLRIIEEEKITTMFAVPTVLWLIFNAPDFERYDLSSLRVMASGGAASPEDLLKCCARKLPGAQLLPGYGLTEANGMTHSTASLEEALSKPGSCGRALPVIEAKIADDSGRELPPGEPGEFLVKGCQVMKGYWNNPEATRATVVDGWLHTGDIASITEEGDVYVLDRLKDMIIRGGENIYSLEVENVLYRNPRVLEAAVVGVPDAIFGEQVKAVIVLRPGEKATQEEIQEFCEKHLARYKVPKYVEFRDALPRNLAGKIIKDSLV
jgi:long-chain acyl-CoA synthetase